MARAVLEFTRTKSLLGKGTGKNNQLVNEREPPNYVAEKPAHDDLLYRNCESDSDLNYCLYKITVTENRRAAQSEWRIHWIQ